MIERDPRLAAHASALHGEPVTPRPAEPAVTPAPDFEEAPAEPVAAVRPAGRAGRRFAWLSSMVVMGGLVGGAVVGLMHFMNGPVQAAAQVVTPSPRPAAAVINPGSNTLAGLTFDMTYPGVFDQLRQLKTDNQAIEQYMISSKSDYRRQMAIEVRPLPSTNLDDESNYKFRFVHPQDYKPRTDKLAGEPVVVMAKNDNSEMTLFWPHKGKVLIISVTSSNPEDVVGDFVKAFEPSLRWHE